MDLRHLEHILLLADELNFSRAAERAHLTQSAFSRSVQAAEAAAGVKFFDRTRRSVKPTAVGLRIIERGRKILFDAVDLDREIRFLEAGVGGEVRVGAGMTVAASILPGVTTSFHRDYPGVRLTIEVSHWSTLVGDLMAVEETYLGTEATGDGALAAGKTGKEGSGEHVVHGQNLQRGGCPDRRAVLRSLSAGAPTNRTSLPAASVTSDQVMRRTWTFLRSRRWPTIAR